MKETYYRQCKLVKGNMHQTSWIPEKFAILNKVLKLKENGKWVDGWVVEKVSKTKLADSMLPDYHQEIKDHRKATGDNLPKIKHT